LPEQSEKLKMSGRIERHKRTTMRFYTSISLGGGAGSEKAK
jgi:hypothetical protein